MAAEVEFDQYDKEYFKILLTTISEESNWEYGKENHYSVDEASQIAAKFTSQVKLDLYHPDTDGTLRLEVPDLTVPLSPLAGTLLQPLDEPQNREPYPDSFGEHLKEAYQSIANEHKHGYLHAGTNPIHITRLQIPFDYKGQKLSQALTAITETSKQVQQLNNDVLTIINQYTKQ